MPEEAIQVKGARVNNLKNVSFSIPINQMTVVTGVSGSGKSSLAFDTIYAEGQRRYVESLSAYARQFLERMDKPDVDEIQGIAPAIAIRQKNSTRNPRSTVGTQTEIYDYLRLLFARVGQTYCRVCGKLVTRDSPDSIADEVLSNIPEGTRFYVLFPAWAGLSGAESGRGDEETQRRGEKGKSPRRRASASRRHLITAHLMSLMQRGFTRLFAGGQIIDLQSPDDYPRADFKDVFVLVDRLTARQDVRQRLVDSLEICFQEGHGTALIETAEPNPKRLWFSERFECKYDHTVYATPEPRLFSFNNPYGACPTCQGFGNTIGLDLDLVIPNPGLSLKDGAIEPWTKPQHEWAMVELKQFCRAEKIPMNVPFNQLSRSDQQAIIEGRDDWAGVRGFFDWMETKKYKLHVRVFLSKYRGYTLCPDCGGGRLRQEARDEGRRSNVARNMRILDQRRC
jgi:excinuclease ABC subunit A